MTAIKAIGFIGTGVMGEPMCRHLATKSGIPVIAFDSNSEPLKRLASHGASQAPIDELARNADVIFMSLPSGDVVRSVIHGQANDGLLHKCKAGQIIVDLSTTPFGLTRELGKELAEHGIAFADAPVMRTRAAAESGTLAVPVGASDDVFWIIEPLIRTFASEVDHMGGIGSGQVVKLLNNMILYETVLALAEARAIGVRAGVDPEKLFTVLSKGSADSFALRNHGMKAIVPQSFPEKAFPLTYALKDLQYAVDLARYVDVDATGARNLIDCFGKAIAAGHGSKYAPAISLVFEGK